VNKNSYCGIFHFAAPDAKLIPDGKDGMRGTVTEKEFNGYLGLIGDGEEGLGLWEKQLVRDIGLPEGSSLVVLNANPFTTGHRYLVSIARKRSSHVLVLVIQGRPESGGRGNHENTGIVFPFDERMGMTKAGLADMDGISVLPSGPYIISRDDFPQGFLSEEMGSVPAHAALDSMVICHVCRALGIKSIFAGDEPRDEMSEIHLNALRTACAGSGIQLRVAERKRLGERYISSSMVRQDIADGNMDEAVLLAPSLAGHSAEDLALRYRPDVDQV
jgi:[citrate (pro-3S)-lyase] ligase